MRTIEDNSNANTKQPNQTDENMKIMEDSIDQEKKSIAKRFEESIKDTIKTARSYYETNRKINIIIVGVGLVFLANAIAHSWFPGFDKNTADNTWLSLASGGLSVASFATLFFTKPQQEITKAFGNLAQIHRIIPNELLYGVFLGPIVGGIIGWLIPFSLDRYTKAKK